MYNITSRLGETWAVLKTPLWPGPLTWFGVITFPLVILFIVNDARRYYISIDQTDIYDATIKTLYYFELFLMSSLVVLIGVGFYKSYQQQTKQWGKKFRFGLSSSVSRIKTIQIHFVTKKHSSNMKKR